MASASLAISRGVDAVARPATASKSLFRRALDRLIALREAEARRQVARYRHIGRYQFPREALELFPTD